MSTRSELYHCFGLGVVELLRTDFRGGETTVHCRHPREWEHSVQVFLGTLLARILYTPDPSRFPAWSSPRWGARRVRWVGRDASSAGLWSSRGIRVRAPNHLSLRAINVAKNAKIWKKLYRKYLKISAKLILRFGKEAERVCGLPETQGLAPVHRGRLDRLWNRMISDLMDVCHIHVRCEERVLEGKKPKGSHLILSTADRAASWIAKGGRVAVVGYKPQIARSPNGLVTAMLVPEGNAADSAMCMPLANAAVANTGGVPRLASFDDGYTSADNLGKLNELGIPDVSFSGSKGRKLLGEEAYDGQTLQEARRNRSAVESFMFCLKHCHQFGQLRRRGMAAVRAELTGKVIVYNVCRIIMLRKGMGARKKANEEDEAACRPRKRPHPEPSPTGGGRSSVPRKGRFQPSCGPNAS